MFSHNDLYLKIGKLYTLTYIVSLATIMFQLEMPCQILYIYLFLYILEVVVTWISAEADRDKNE